MQKVGQVAFSSMQFSRHKSQLLCEYNLLARGKKQISAAFCWNLYGSGEELTGNEPNDLTLGSLEEMPKL